MMFLIDWIATKDDRSFHFMSDEEVVSKVQKTEEEDELRDIEEDNRPLHNEA